MRVYDDAWDILRATIKGIPLSPTKYDCSGDSEYLPAEDSYLLTITIRKLK